MKVIAALVTTSFKHATVKCWNENKLFVMWFRWNNWAGTLINDQCVFQASVSSEWAGAVEGM